MSDEHPKISEDKVFFIDKQEVIIDDFKSSSIILDIGGGGEGVIGQLKGDQVIAIDPQISELEEAPTGSIKIVMDATEMKFLNCSFDIATLFYTLMYINGMDHLKVFQEVFRVLRPGGVLKVWEIEFPPRGSKKQDIVAFYVDIKLPDRVIETGYGSKWPTKTQGLAYYKLIGEQVGFINIYEKVNGSLLYLELQKPS